jgi:hypothetical protein
MEFFLPSVLVLLLAAAVVFFIFPRFGPLTLAIVSLVLLILGVYNHSTQFGAEYRLSTWQYALTAYSPFVLIGVLLLAIIGYLFFLAPGASPTVAAPVTMPTVSNMPPPETATNALTATVNRGLNAVANVFGANNKRNNGANGGLLGNIMGNTKRNVANANRSAGPFSLI